MVEEAAAPSLARAGSVVPVSCHQSDSAVLAAPIDSVWALVKELRLNELIPGKVKSVSWTGAPGQVESIASIEYNDGAKWEVLVTEVSNLRHSIGYSILSTEPAHSVTSMQSIITLRPITSTSHTFIEWSTDFSNDADANIIQDQHFKKLEFFTDMAAKFAA